jgi:hypothetical protein
MKKRERASFDPRKFILVADTDGSWYVRRVKWTIDDAERGLMVYECDAPVGQAFEFAEQGLAALRDAFRKQNAKKLAGDPEVSEKVNKRKGRARALTPSKAATKKKCIGHLVHDPYTFCPACDGGPPAQHKD